MSHSSLLFCDTFYHGHDEEDDVHIDLVGFRIPVHIQEVRIIPHGCRVHPSISERDKIGETSPSCIKLETFVKNLNKPEAKVFEKLGVLDFVEGESIQLITNSKVATNVILLRGRYKNLTVALYGEFKNVAVDSNQVPPPPPPVSEPRLPTARIPPHSMVPPHMDPNLAPLVHNYGASPREYDMEMERRDRREHGMYNVDQGRMNRPWHGKQENEVQDWHMKQEYPREEPEHLLQPSYDPHARRMKDYDADMARRDETRRGNEKPPVKEKLDPRKPPKADPPVEAPSGTSKTSLTSLVQASNEQSEAKQEPKACSDIEAQPAGAKEDVDKAATNAGDDLFESLSSEEGEMFDVSNKRPGRDEMGYENIESDEEYMDDYEFEDTANLQNLHDMDIYGSDDAWMSVSVSFNPYQCYLGPLESFTPITQTKYATNLKQAEARKSTGEDKNFEAKKLLATLIVNKHMVKSEKWVALLQDLPPILVQALAQVKVESPEKEKEVVEILMEWSTHALKYEEASKLPIAMNIRMLKTGMELVSAMAQCSVSICKTMINTGVQELLISLLKESHMASSMKLKCLQALDATTYSPWGMEHILGWDVEHDGTPNAIGDRSGKKKDRGTLYEELVEYLLTEQTVRVAAAIKCLLRKLHFYEAAANFQNIAESLSRRLPPEPQDVKSDVEERKEEPSRAGNLLTDQDGVVSEPVEDAKMEEPTREALVKQESGIEDANMEEEAPKSKETIEAAEGKVTEGNLKEGSGSETKSNDRKEVEEGEEKEEREDKKEEKEKEEDYIQEEKETSERGIGGKEEHAPHGGAAVTEAGRPRAAKVEIETDSVKDEFEGAMSGDAFVNQQEVDIIVSALEEIFCVVENAGELVMQPSPRAFPTSVKLTETAAPAQWEEIYGILGARRFLEAVLVVMTSPAFCDPTVYTSIRNLLFHFLQHERGLLFLASNPSTLNGMIRVLTQSSDTEPHYSEAPSLHELISDATMRENCTTLHLGLLLIYYLQTLQGVDQLFASSRDGLSHAEMDSEENRSTLHTLYSMTFTPIGKAAVVSVLSLGSNLGCLLPFFDDREEATDNKHRRPVSSKYASILLLLTLQNSENMNMLERFGSKLLVCVQKRENDVMFTDLGHWIAPLKHIIKLNLFAVPNLVEFIKSELDHFKLNSHHAKGILTALRILKYITCPPMPIVTGAQRAQLVSQGVIKLFSANGMDIFIQLLNKLTEILMGPWRQNQPFSSSHCLVLVTLAVPLLSLIDSMLQELISCASIQFKDTRLLHGVFALHTVLCSLPPAGALASFIQRLQGKMITILLKFTAPTSKVPESEEAVKTTTWYLLMKELLSYTISVPQAFLSGIILLSELLPVPFPVHVIEEMVPAEIQHIQTQRILWMLHLSVLNEEVVGVFHSLVGSCSQIVHHYLQKVCSQLVDLGLTTAVSTVRLIIELLLKVNQEEKLEEGDKTKEDEGEVVKKITSNISMRIISLLAYAVSQPGGKLAYLHLTRPSKKGEEAEYPTLTKQLLAVLESSTEKSEQIRTIDYVLSLLQSLCDPEICLSEFEEPMTLQHLSNSLPNVEALHDICESLVLHLKLANQPYSSVLQVIRTLAALTDHDIGAQTLKKTLMHHHSCLHDLLARIASSVASLSVKAPDNDLLTLLSTLPGFLQLLLPTQATVTSVTEGETASETYPLTTRSVHISYAEMRALLRFTDIESQHSLKQLENALAERAKEDESFEGLLSVVRSLVETLSNERTSPQGKDDNIELPPPESIQTLFQRRVMSMTTLIGDERMGPSLWLAVPDFEDVDPHTDMVKCDLEAMAEKYCAGFNLKEEVEKGFVVFSEAEKMKQRKKGKRRLDPLVTQKGGHVDDTKRLRLDASFLHPRGRGNPRGNWRGRGGGRGVDLFRSRKQNTSRPPSMHVDDFVVMEKHDPAVIGTPPSGKQLLKGGIPTIRGANSDPRPNTNGGFATSHGRWGGPHPTPFRREVGQNMQPMPGGQRAFDWMMSRTPPVQGAFQQYNRMFPRQSDWNPPMQSPYNRVPRETPYMRSQGRGSGGGGGSSSGGYWAGPKAKEESRFFPVGTVTGYRQGRGGMGRHMRTCTR